MRDFPRPRSTPSSQAQIDQMNNAHMKQQADKHAQDMQVPLVLIGLFCLAILYGFLTPQCAYALLQTLQTSHQIALGALNQQLKNASEKSERLEQAQKDLEQKHKDVQEKHDVVVGIASASLLQLPSCSSQQRKACMCSCAKLHHTHAHRHRLAISLACVIERQKIREARRCVCARQ